MCRRYAKHTAVTLRLVKKWFGTGRIVYGDSFFASVSTAVALRNFGLFFIGIVKTAHAGFPKLFLKNGVWKLGPQPPSRGQSRHMRATIKNGNGEHTVYAHCWNDPGPPSESSRQFVSTVGDTNPADPHMKTRFITDENDPDYGKYVQKAVNRPTVVKMYHENASVIDIHNHSRQGVMGIEKNVGTKNYIFRMFTTLFAMSMVDAHKVYNKERTVDRQVKLRDFLDAICVVLLTNRLDGCPELNDYTRVLRRRNVHVNEEEDAAETLSGVDLMHDIIPVAEYGESTWVYREQEQTVRKSRHLRCGARYTAVAQTAICAVYSAARLLERFGECVAWALRRSAGRVTCLNRFGSRDPDV